MMADGFSSVVEGIEAGGLRLAVLRGVPSPWSQAAMGILHVKDIDHTKVCLAEGEDRAIFNEWTGQDAFPAAMYEDERPRTGWEEILWLAERLSPAPRLVPADPEARVRMFGLSREICGEMGLGWCRRLMAMAGPMKGSVGEGPGSFGHKYGSSPEQAKVALERVIEILGLLARQLADSKVRGHRYLMGAQLSAVDIYWATFCNLVDPLPIEKLPLPEAMHPLFKAKEPEIHAALDPSLLDLRDLVYTKYLELPVQL